MPPSSGGAGVVRGGGGVEQGGPAPAGCLLGPPTVRPPSRFPVSLVTLRPMKNRQCWQEHGRRWFSRGVPCASGLLEFTTISTCASSLATGGSHGSFSRGGQRPV